MTFRIVDSFSANFRIDDLVPEHDRAIYFSFLEHASSRVDTSVPQYQRHDSCCFFFSHAEKTAPQPQSQLTGPGQQVPTEPGPGFAVQAPEDLLRPGAVHSIDQALMEKGYLSPNSRQTLDPPTRDALARFQRDNGLAATGFPDAETLRKLGFSPDKIYLPPQSIPEASK